MAEPGLEVELRTDAEGWRGLSGPVEPVVRAAAEAAFDAATDLEAAELSVLLTDDRTIAELNTEWRSKQGPTNVLSFPAGDAVAGGRVLLGDVVLALETVQREAAATGIPETDHLSHLVVHSVLHLLGFDHETGPDAEEMEAWETSILAGLGVPNPYAGLGTREAV